VRSEALAGVGGVAGCEEDLDVEVGLESMLLVVGEDRSETGLEIPGELDADSISSITSSWSSV